MSKAQKYEELTEKEEAPEEKRLRLLLERAERIYNDLDDLIGELDAIYIDKKSAREGPPKDFLSSDTQNKPRKNRKGRT